jgi:uncharacterized protein YndB with AHSA1/START domain
MSESKDGRELRLEIEIAASPETVFALLTEAAGMKTWLSDLVDCDCRPGGVFRITGPRGGSIEGTYLEIVPSRRVVFTWGGINGMAPGETTVEFDLEPRGRGTLLRLRHHGLPEQRVEPHYQGWAIFALPKLKESAECRPPATRSMTDYVEARDRGRA